MTKAFAGLILAGLLNACAMPPQQPTYTLTDAQKKACRDADAPTGSHIQTCQPVPSSLDTNRAAALGSLHGQYGSAGGTP